MRHDRASLHGVWDTAKGVCHPVGTDCFAWAKFWAGGLTYYGGTSGRSSDANKAARAIRAAAGTVLAAALTLFFDYLVPYQLIGRRVIAVAIWQVQGSLRVGFSRFCRAILPQRDRHQPHFG